MKVLVTGGTGFLGAHLIFDLLKKGYNVRGIRRSASSSAEFDLIKNVENIGDNLLENLEWAEADILDTSALADAVEGVDMVFHAAAVVSFWKPNHEKMMQINAEGTANVVNCCLSAGVKKLCYASSIAALGREKTGDIIDENTPWKNSKYNSRYSISKYLAEMEVWRGIEEGLDAVIVNPGIILGEGLWHKGSCRLFDAAYKGLKFYTNGSNGYVDVEDVCRAMIQLAESDITAQRYVLVAQNLVFRDLFNKMADAFGRPRPIIKVGPFLSHAARYAYGLKAALTGGEPLVTRETARNSLQQFSYKNDKIKRDLGFEFLPLDESIKRICAAYLKSKNIK